MNATRVPPRDRKYLALSCGLGAITWAIRGTSGWGGFDGAVVPGMLWALLMYTYLQDRGVPAGWACFLFGLGIAVGGMWGYGTYITWIGGDFVSNASPALTISPLVGYAWLFVTGFAWGAPAAVMFCWEKWRVDLKGWILRATLPAACVGLFFVIRALAPNLIFPYYSAGIYDDPTCTICQRIVSTNTTNGVVFSVMVGALLADLILKQATPLKLVLLVGGLFGLAFAAASAWMLLSPVSHFTDWWKVWELTMGFASGGVVFLFLKRYQKAVEETGESIAPGISQGKILALFAFFGITLYGCTSQLGVLLGLYPEGFVQYDLPPARLVLVIIFLVPFFLWFAWKLTRGSPFVLDDRFWAQLACFICLVGIVTIWPSNLVVVYFLLFWLAIVPIITRFSSDEDVDEPYVEAKKEMEL